RWPWRVGGSSGSRWRRRRARARVTLAHGRRCMKSRGGRRACGDACWQGPHYRPEQESHPTSSWSMPLLALRTEGKAIPSAAAVLVADRGEWAGPEGLDGMDAELAEGLFTAGVLLAGDDAAVGQDVEAG